MNMKRGENPENFSMSEALCRVCQLQPSNSFNHYGATGICFSCRNFFKRSVQTKQFPHFRCKKQADSVCLINSKTRQSCKKCRFQKCIEVGMKVKWVQEKEGEKQVLVRIQKSLGLQMTTEEYQLIKKVTDTFNQTACEQYFQFFAQDSASLYSWLKSSYDGEILSFQDFQKLTLADLVSFTEIALKAFSIDDTLTMSDRCQLIQSNLKSVLGFAWASIIDFNDTDIFVREMAKFGRENSSAFGVEQLLPIIENFIWNSQSKVIVGGSLYPLIFSSPWAPNIELEEKHYELSMLVNKWVGCSLDQGIDLPMLVLAVMILFTSTLDIEGVDKEKIEPVHLNYVLLLQRYLKYKYPREANKRLGDILMLHHPTRELFELHSMRLPI